MKTNNISSNFGTWECAYQITQSSYLHIFTLYHIGSFSTSRVKPIREKLSINEFNSNYKVTRIYSVLPNIDRLYNGNCNENYVNDDNSEMRLNRNVYLICDNYNEKDT